MIKTLFHITKGCYLPKIQKQGLRVNNKLSGFISNSTRNKLYLPKIKIFNDAT